MLEEKQQMLIVAEEDDDGPPPGFQCIIAPQPETGEPNDQEDDDEEEDGPPPGFHPIAPQPTHDFLSHDDDGSSKLDNIDEDDDEEDGPPPGWGFDALVDVLPKATSSTIDIKEEGSDDLDDEPPPGWESVLQSQMPPTPPLGPPSTISSNFACTEIKSKQKTTRNDDEVPPSEAQCMSMPGQLSPAAPPLQKPPPPELLYNAGIKNGYKKFVEEKPAPGHKLASHQLPPNPSRPLTSVSTSSSSEKAQLVCGTCRKLCVYPRGSKWVQCPGCQEVNFVLEGHEVGQVNCGGCSVLLLYPHRAPAVRCSSCLFVTEIGAHNRRPPLSVQQMEARAQRRNRRAR